MDDATIDAGDERLHPVTLRFRDAALERAYWINFFDTNQRYLRFGVLFILAVLLAVTPVEAAILPGRYAAMWAVRFYFIVPVTLLATVLIYVPRLSARVTRRHPQEWIFVTSALVTSGVGAQGVIVLAGGGLEHFMYGAFAYMLTAMFIYLGLRLRFPYALALGWGSYWVSVAIIVDNGGADELTMALMFTFAFAANVLGMFGCYLVDLLSRRHFLSLRELERERGRVDRLLENILPVPIAERLKERQQAIANDHDAVTVLFADIVGFTPLSARLEPRTLVGLLNEMFSAFDEISARHGVEKIKTIGDAYMAAAGLPTPNPEHAAAIARMALEMRGYVERHGRHEHGQLSLRIGIHSGPVVAGVIGTKKFIYDLWGDTVNTASRMESHGASGKIQVSASARALLVDRFVLSERGVIDVKGKGPMPVYWLERERPRATPDDAGGAG